MVNVFGIFAGIVVFSRRIELSFSLKYQKLYESTLVDAVSPRAGDKSIRTFFELAGSAATLSLGTAGAS